MYNPMDFTGKKILVTGASSGIGRACAIMLSRLGAGVVLAARRMSALQETLSQMDPNEFHTLYSGDIRDPDAIAKLVEVTGKIDGLVYAAGIGPMCPVGFLARDEVLKVMETNYFSFLELVKYYSKAKNRNDGFSIVAVSSVSAFVGWGGGVAYCGSKGALSASVRALAMELASKGVRVNSVCPSNIKTPLYDAGAADINTEAGIAALKAKQPLGLGAPDQVASAVTFLLSDAASFITGVNLPVDGGYLAQ